MSYVNNFHYQILGSESSPKLIFLHGLMGFGSNWKSIARHFQDQYQILLYDQRGHGRSFQPQTGYRSQDYAEDLRLILKDLAWKKVSLVGHSMGGRVAVEYAALHPSAVSKLVIVDIGPESDAQSMASIKEKIQFVPVPFANREEAKNFFAGPFLKKFNNNVVAQFFYTNLEPRDDGQLDWRFNAKGVIETLESARNTDQWLQFKSLSMPTLLVRGEKSTDLTEAAYREVLASNSAIRGEVVAGAGHWLHVEKPQETIEILKKFLK